MKHFASHYLYLPGTGFLKQQVVTVSDEGFVEAIAPLTHEVESVEWIPGVIALFSPKQLEALKKNTAGFARNHQDGCEQSSRHFQTTIKALKEKSIFLYPCVFYPFDFTSMQPVAGTRHKLLR